MCVLKNNIVNRIKTTAAGAPLLPKRRLSVYLFIEHYVVRLQCLGSMLPAQHGSPASCLHLQWSYTFSLIQRTDKEQNQMVQMSSCIVIKIMLWKLKIQNFTAVIFVLNPIYHNINISYSPYVISRPDGPRTIGPRRVNFVDNKYWLSIKIETLYCPLCGVLKYHSKRFWTALLSEATNYFALYTIGPILQFVSNLFNKQKTSLTKCHLKPAHTLTHRVLRSRPWVS